MGHKDVVDLLDLLLDLEEGVSVNIRGVSILQEVTDVTLGIAQVLEQSPASSHGVLGEGWLKQVQGGPEAATVKEEAGPVSGGTVGAADSAALRLIVHVIHDGGGPGEVGLKGHGGQKQVTRIVSEAMTVFLLVVVCGLSWELCTVPGQSSDQVAVGSAESSLQMLLCKYNALERGARITQAHSNNRYKTQ